MKATKVHFLKNVKTQKWKHVFFCVNPLSESAFYRNELLQTRSTQTEDW